MKTKKRILILGAVVLVYITLMMILVASEAGVEGSSIHGLGDAVWYSVVTLTTVGYGDSYPVSGAGRAVGIILVLCSLGLLSALITGMVTTITGFTIPMYYLRKQRKKHWNVFISDNEVSQVMADELKQEYPDSVTIFLTEGDKVTISLDGEPASGRFRIRANIRWLINNHSGRDGVSVFCFGEDVWENYRLGRRIIHDYRIPVYCLTEVKSDREVKKLTLYDPVEGLGRFYWTRFPVQSHEKTFIIAGCQDMGGSVLERGLQTNIFQPDRGIHYIIAGDSEKFRKMHYRMCQETDPYPDRLSFYPSIWDLDPVLIKEADRIIICHDRETENLSIYQKLVSHYAISGKVHVYTNSKLQQGHTRTFGHLTDIYTPALVMQEKRSSMAKKMHELYRKSTSKTTTSWKGLTEFQKQSNIAAADHILVKCRILLGDRRYERIYAKQGINAVLKEAFAVYEEARKDPDQLRCFRNIEHNRWMRFHILYNWEYDSIRNNTLRRHPLMMAFGDLPGEEQTKDDNAWELIGKVGEGV